MGTQLDHSRLLLIYRKASLGVFWNQKCPPEYFLVPFDPTSGLSKYKQMGIPHILLCDKKISIAINPLYFCAYSTFW